MSDVEQELWNIFTFYTLHGNPLDLANLSITNLLRLARDCQITHGSPRHSHAKGGGRRLSQADVHLVYASILQRREKVNDHSTHTKTSEQAAELCSRYVEGYNKRGKLTYGEFLNGLMALAERMYGRGGGMERGKSRVGLGVGTGVGRGQLPVGMEEAFEELLMENILPLASRRTPRPIDGDMHDPLVEDLLRHFAPALLEIFRFYATSPSLGRGGARRGTSGSAEDQGKGRWRRPHRDGDEGR
ncbi:unnamed protein product, partial [Discosporangium mesarthrocarpum]